jgi:ubiquinone/menaquinone biosynthesis C-methylase UbiE
VGKNSLALDVGCGTGIFMEKLAKSGYRTIGLDFSKTALKFASYRLNGGLVLANAMHLPFRSVFDLVLSIDLLEVDNVDPKKLVGQVVRTMKPEGFGLFVMASHQWLLSEHDRAVHSVRRFNMSQLLGLFAGRPVTIIRATYLFSFLFPLIALHKLSNPSKESDKPAASDLRMPHPFINTLLYLVCWLENHVLSLINLPIGSSVAILVRKHA